jgi:phosphoglycerate dehydrogenase-like enzyme
MPNVVITPHMSGRSALTRERWNAVFVENIRRFGAGEPLLNVVDKAAGY